MRQTSLQRKSGSLFRERLSSLREKSEKTLALCISNSRQNRHPERSASQTFREPQRSVRGVEGPRGRLSYLRRSDLFKHRTRTGLGGSPLLQQGGAGLQSSGKAVYLSGQGYKAPLPLCHNAKQKSYCRA